MALFGFCCMGEKIEALSENVDQFPANTYNALMGGVEGTYSSKSCLVVWSENKTCGTLKSNSDQMLPNGRHLKIHEKLFKNTSVFRIQ